MTDQELRVLRAQLASLVEQKRMLDHAAEKLNNLNVEVSHYDSINRTVSDVRRSFPDLIPDLDERTLRRLGDLVGIAGLRSYLAEILPRLEDAVSRYTAEEASLEQRAFPFVKNERIRSIVERDDQEVHRANNSQCWKSVIILCGGAIEAILLDLLEQHESRALSASNAPRASKGGDVKPLGRWDLSDLITVAVELVLVGGGLGKLSHSVREYRNLVHAGNEIRSGLTVDREEAKIALEILNMLHRELGGRLS